MNSQKPIHIFFATTDNYVKYMDVAITSLIENASKDYNYKIVILSCGLSPESEKILKEHESQNFEIEFKNVQDQLDKLKDIMPQSFIFTVATYYRFFIEPLYPEIDKAIYLDGDIIVKGDISKLYNVDLENNLVAAVNEQNCFLMPLMTTYTEQVSGIDPHKFFNAGVMVLNLAEIRKFQLLNKFVDLVNKYNFETPLCDEDYLNNLCRNRVKLLPNGWNKESVVSQKLEGELFIRHYAFGAKPWKTKDVEDAELFWEYAQKSKYYQILLDEFEKVTPEQLQKDQANAFNLIQMAERLLQSDHTFKKLIIDVEDKKQAEA